MIADIINKERYVVIGRLVKDDLFGNEDAIGKYINGGGRTWKVIGVYQDDGGIEKKELFMHPILRYNLFKEDLIMLAQYFNI